MLSCNYLARYSIEYFQTFICGLKLSTLSTDYLHVSGASLKTCQNPSQTELYLARVIAIKPDI